jgi:hypothetical protein
VDTITIGLADAVRCRPAGSRAMNRVVDRRAVDRRGGWRSWPGAIHLDLYVTGYKSIPTIGWLFLLQVIAAFEARRNCRGIRQPADRTRRMRQSRMPRVPAAAAGCRVGVAVCRSGHRSVGVSPDAGPRVPHWPRSSGHAWLRPLPCAGVVALRSACPWPVCRWSVRSRSCGAASPNPGSGAPARCGNHARSPCVFLSPLGACQVRHGRDRPGHPIVRDR